MGAKRALIVDDSRSARLFLARMLEKYEIDVDSAESAEAAIVYLASHRPDVIFMDHLMPGMDGFQAVQAIKNNPRTATIPILMYTSQEGELYLGQARALGAVGVLPKQIKPTDVSKVLYQLHLVADRRTSEQTTFRPIGVPSAGDGLVEDQVGPGSAGASHRPLTDTLLREQFAELRRALVAGIDTQTDRITAEVRALLLEALPPASEAHPIPKTQPPPWGWIVAGVALAIALVSTALWWRDLTLLRSMAADLGQIRVEMAQRAAPPQAPVAETLPLAPPSEDAAEVPQAAGPAAGTASGAAPAAAAGPAACGTSAASSDGGARGSVSATGACGGAARCAISTRICPRSAAIDRRRVRSRHHSAVLTSAMANATPATIQPQGGGWVLGIGCASEAGGRASSSRARTSAVMRSVWVSIPATSARRSSANCSRSSVSVKGLWLAPAEPGPTWSSTRPSPALGTPIGLNVVCSEVRRSATRCNW